VGLGKTIEAGMIIHHQLHTGRASRVLILVPDSLVHQWLVEMLRRFNLRFALFDESRFVALLESPDIDLDTGEAVNPFDMEQLIICSIDGLMRHQAMQQQLLQCQWDLLVVDEAHHLHWSENEVSSDYQLVEQVGKQAKGLLLLTATPEQAGLDSHFARLRLLDPDRFHDLAAFREEAGRYQGISKLVEQLNQAGVITAAELRQWVPEGLSFELPEGELDQAARQKLLDQLIDQHGTGRVLFRNTRSAITGFPERKLHAYPLACPEIYTPEDDDPMHLGWDGLTPEQELVPEVWLPRDPRVSWLEQTLTELKPEKVLVIAHHATTAKALQGHFSKKLGFKCSCFHEGMTLVERDRAAAYFADRDEGAQVLFCSEIGSEGRNFQFAHHLIFFDLPANPDLVEQRIGRLDRIGQRDTIEIHVPYLQPSAQSVLFDWYHRGLNLFEQSFSAGYSVYEAFHDRLTEALQLPEAEHNDLIDATQQQVAQLRQQMEQGRDRLLELNSCRQPQADQWVEQILEQEEPHQLADYFEKLLNEFGVEQEDHSTLSWVLRPSDHMKHSYFPGLREEGTTVTVDRLKALSRDDIEFLSWEHPMVVEAMDMMVKSDTGNATAVTISVKGLKPGTLLLESYFTLQSIAPKALQIHRFLSQQPIRVLVDANGKDLSQVVSHKALNGLSQPLKKKVARQVIEQVKKPVETMVNRCEALVQSRVAALKQMAAEKVEQLLGAERQRLLDLKAINPNIRQEEIEILEQLIASSLQHIERASLQLQGVKLIVAS
jgi:ATP-dependent helicase HepA